MKTTVLFVLCVVLAILWVAGVTAIGSIQAEPGSLRLVGLGLAVGSVLGTGVVALRYVAVRFPA